eukprot:TRINITY_DN3180_c0_g1_i1.p2 TRINITY_DN3180_c0_g1~~TRINITY_DN3180_c0_g1_i1.p2  ORF type:complete len:107 (-),score=25.57 TRINITY_DN3180_c0_g1_i1:251-571(-)
MYFESTDMMKCYASARSMGNLLELLGQSSKAARLKEIVDKDISKASGVDDFVLSARDAVVSQLAFSSTSTNRQFAASWNYQEPSIRAAVNDIVSHIDKVATATPAK